MTSATPTETAIRVRPLVYWLLSGLAAGLAVLVASPVLPDGWRLGVGVVNAVVVLLVARSQPETADDRDDRRSSTRPPPAALGAFWVLLVLVLLVCSSGCLSLWRGAVGVPPSEVASCPIGKECVEGSPGLVSDDCESIAYNHDVFVILAGVFGGVATAGGAAVPFLSDYPDALAGVGAGAAGSAALGVTFGSLAAWEADRFTRWCGGAAP